MIIPYRLIELLCDSDMCMRYGNRFRKALTLKEVLEMYEANKHRIK